MTYEEIYRSSTKYWSALNIAPVPTARKMRPLDLEMRHREPIVKAGTVSQMLFLVLVPGLTATDPIQGITEHCPMGRLQSWL